MTVAVKCPKCGKFVAGECPCQTPEIEKSSGSTPLADKSYMAVGLFGGPGCGKSSLEWEWMLDYDRRGGKVIAIDRARQFGRFGFWPKEGVRGLDAWLENDIKDKFHGLLVLDDADIYLKPRSTGEWVDLIVAFRHWGLDILVSGRAPQGIDTNLLRCLEHVALFRMKEANAVNKIEEWLGADVADNIPTEKHQYLMVDIFGDTMTMKHTKPMVVQSTATGKRLA